MKNINKINDGKLIKMGLTLVALIATIILVAGCAGAGQESPKTANLVVKSQYNQGLTLEYGAPINLVPETFLDFGALDEKRENEVASEVLMKLKVNTLSGAIDLEPSVFANLQCGTYFLTLGYNGEIKVIDVKVVDTVAPTISGLSSIDVFQDQPLDQADVAKLLEVSDLSPTQTNYDFSTVDFAKPGSYQLAIFAFDSSNNSTRHQVTINVLEPAQEDEEVATKRINNDDGSFSIKLILTKIVKEEPVVVVPEVVKPKPVDYVTSYSFASRTSQIIDVKVRGNTGTLSLHNKNNGVWSQVFSVFCYIGENGLSYDRTEGDMTTPGGYYWVGAAFGIASDPGCPQGYHQVTPYDYWLGSSDEYYNQLVDVRDGDYDLSGAEHLIDYTKAYRYSLDIGYNTDGVIGKGAAIFLHCSTGGTTAGCVSISESYMIRILRNLRSDTIIYIH